MVVGLKKIYEMLSFRYSRKPKGGKWVDLAKRMLHILTKICKVYKFSFYFTFEYCFGSKRCTPLVSRNAPWTFVWARYLPCSRFQQTISSIKHVSYPSPTASLELCRKEEMMVFVPLNMFRTTLKGIYDRIAWLYMAVR